MSVSGNTIATWPASGRNAVYITNQSGNVAQSITPISNFADNHTFSTLNAPIDVGLNYGYDENGGKWNRVRTTTSGNVGSASGTSFRLLTDTIQHGSTLRTGNFVTISDVSGGVPLTINGGLTPLGIQIRSADALGGRIHIGSITNPPFVSGGFQLNTNGDETTHIPIDRPDNVRLWAENSGASISWMGFDI